VVTATDDKAPTPEPSDDVQEGKLTTRQAGITRWQPTELQRKLVSVFQQNDYDIDVKGACHRAGVARQRLYVWRKNPEFRAWWDNRKAEHWWLKTYRVEAARYRAATQDDAPGNPQERAAYLNEHGRPGALVNSGGAPVQINVVGDSAINRLLRDVPNLAAESVEGVQLPDDDDPC